MKALVFRYSYTRFAFVTLFGKINPGAYLGPISPLSLESIPEPILPADDWVLVQTQICGICGSDVKQVFLDGNFDNPLTAFISFPQVLCHEIVGIIERTGRVNSTRFKRKPEAKPSKLFLSTIECSREFTPFRYLWRKLIRMKE
jgi:hypothetical protein